MFAQFLSKLFAPSAARPPRRSGGCALRLELLEDRWNPNNRFIVPVGAPVDNVANFATLSAALTTAGLATGDAIQIEPGSVPGNVTNANFTAAFTTTTALTIKGSTSAPASLLPQFTISDATTIAATRTLNLTGVNVGLVADGSLAFSGNTTISTSLLVDASSSATTPFTFAGTMDNLINSTVVNSTPVGSTVLQITTNAAGTSHLISGNTFVSNAPTNAQLAWYTGSGVAVTDLLTNNTFTANPGGATSFSIVVQETGLSGLVIQNNRFSGPIGTGILQAAPATNLQLLNNTFDLNAATPIGISVVGGGVASSGTIANNVIKTNGAGTGVQINVGAGTVSLKVEGNDFHANKIGVKVVAGANSIGDIDFGAGTRASRGGNNFRSFTFATSTVGAVVTDSTTGSMFAQRNIFGVANPQTVIFRSGAGTVSTTNQLTGNAAFVQTLFTQFLRRTGDTNNANDAGAWVNFMTNGGTQAQVANGIIRSAESLGYVVDDLYRTILRRAADPIGRAYHVNLLASGWSIEAVQNGLYGGAEYAVYYPGDAAFVGSLFWTVLGRAPDQASINSWVALIPTYTRGGVANGFINSTESRTAQVRTAFFDVLKRTAATAPTAPQVTAWVNSGNDVLTLRVIFAGTAEFFVAG